MRKYITGFIAGLIIGGIAWAGVITPAVNADKADLIAQATIAVNNLDQIGTNCDTISSTTLDTVGKCSTAIKELAAQNKKIALYEKKIIKRLVQIQ